MCSEQPRSLIWIHIHVFIQETFHLIIIWPLRHDDDSGGTQPRLWPSSSSQCGSLSGPLVWQEHDLSNALGLLSQVHTLLSLCLSYRFSPLRYGLSLWISLLFAAASKQAPNPRLHPHHPQPANPHFNTLNSAAKSDQHEGNMPRWHTKSRFQRHEVLFLEGQQRCLLGGFNGSFWPLGC